MSRRAFHYSVALIALSAAAACGDDGPVAQFVTDGDFLAIVDDNGQPQPLYVKGVNLGVGVPGTYPGQLALDRETYLRWFERMNETGINTLRIYTLHHPAFYEALFEYNNFRPNEPLYVMHGGWLDEDNPTGGLDLYDLTEAFDRSIEEVVDAVHGNVEIEHRLGRGFGKYEVDVSRWVLAYVVGREMFPGEVLTTDALHVEDSSFQGRFLSIQNATATETWVTKRLDHALDYEERRYNQTRPIGFSNWPTLDPLTHDTEPHFIDESNLYEGGEDDAQIDIAKIDFSRAPAGLFASYHAYPYYPDFVYRDPDYQLTVDHIGPNNYLGYLRDLKEHYREMPLLVLEYGVPSSWGNAHSSPPTGMSHGGHDEVSQGEMNARLTRNIADAGCGGGAVFAWMDEWWKLTWVVAHRTYPIERFPVWPDVLSPEQNFGLIAYDIAPPLYNQWPTTLGAGKIAEIDADLDARYFHVRIALESPLLADETVEIGFDTHRDDLGESVLPSGTPTEERIEIAMVLSESLGGQPRQAQVYVTEAYDLFGLAKGLSEPAQIAQSIASDGAGWKPWVWVTAEESHSDDLTYQFPLVTSNQGALRVRLADDEPSSLDSVVISDTHIEIRIPWTLLQFSDPSQLEVVHDDLSTRFRRESMRTAGIKTTVRIGDSVATTARLDWSGWDEPPETIEREKPGLEAFAQVLREL